jgi:hypothetical protein
LIADRGTLIEIANATARFNSSLLELRESATERWPGTRVKFAQNVRGARENLFRTFQNTDFSSFCIDFDATRSWQGVI